MGPSQVWPRSRPRGTLLDIGSPGHLWYVFPSPFALDAMPPILQLPILTFALPTSVATLSLTLIVHTLNVAHITTIQQIFLLFGHRCSLDLPMMPCRSLTFPPRTHLACRIHVSYTVSDSNIYGPAPGLVKGRHLRTFRLSSPLHAFALA